MLLYRCALAVSIFLGTTTAFADPPPTDTPPPRAVRLEYTFPLGADCPDEATFKDRVRARMRVDPFDADAPARVIVKLFPAEQPGWFRGHGELLDSTGTLLWQSGHGLNAVREYRVDQRFHHRHDVIVVVGPAALRFRGIPQRGERPIDLTVNRSYFLLSFDLLIGQLAGSALGGPAVFQKQCLRVLFDSRLEVGFERGE